MGEIKELVSDIEAIQDVPTLAEAKFMLTQELAFHNAIQDLTSKENQDILIRQYFMGLETVPYVIMAQKFDPETIIMIHRYLEQGVDFEYREKVLEGYKDEQPILGEKESTETLLNLVNVRLTELGYGESATGSDQTLQ